MIRHRALMLGACLAGLVAFSATEAEAQQIQGIRPEIHIGPGWGGANAGFRIDIPIVPQGFIRSGSIRDELAISPGLDLYYFWWAGAYRGFDLGPIVMLQWNLYLGNSNWSIFPELGLAMGFLGAPWWWNGTYYGWWLTPAAAFGVRYHFDQRLSLVFRAVWPGGLQVGLTF